MNQIVVIFKKSLYEIYFNAPRQPDPSVQGFSDTDLQRLRQAHDVHSASMDLVHQALESRGLSYRKIYRARRLNYDPYDLVVSVGGDGTFIEAARRVKTQAVLGVNSDPTRSHGNFCATDAAGFGAALDALADGTAKIQQAQRMALKINGEEKPFYALNDVLAAHQCPGAMSRYRLQIGDVEESQRGSGIWFSTAAGSTGAIQSAGGKPMRFSSRRMQYKCRELFADLNVPSYELRGGILPEGTPIRVTSRMREGMLYVDGAHLRLPWAAGAVLELNRCDFPLNVVRAADLA